MWHEQTHAVRGALPLLFLLLFRTLQDGNEQRTNNALELLCIPLFQHHSKLFSTLVSSSL